ncbi:RHS repeat domain-containing protein, partial [Burkholderia reimsis]|uniref:RHS repeat domain-containing protein n=1 Tax=Burkholderia reimsis TaxID=2234132 RepID=UPI001FCBBC10
MALGDESFTHTDFVIPGVMPVEWARTYRSNFGAHDGQGPLGPRWTTPYHVAFEAKGDELVYHDASGRSLTYPALKPGQPHYDAIESCVLTRESDDRIRLVRGETLTETYERHGARFALTKIEDRSGNTVTLTWADGLLTTIKSASDAVASLTHDREGRIMRVALVDDSGTAVRVLARYRYDEAGDLVEAADENAASWSYAYSHHLVTRYTDRTGRGMNLEWDGTHLDAKAVHEWADDGTFDTRLTWHDRLRLTFVTDALGNTTQQYYDIDGYVYRIVYPDNTEEWFFRDAAKHVTRHVFADGTEESFTWDDAGHLTSHTQQDGRTAHYVYDRHGNLTGLQDPEGHRWERYYDSKGRVTEAL